METLWSHALSSELNHKAMRQPFGHATSDYSTALDQLLMYGQVYGQVPSVPDQHDDTMSVPDQQVSRHATPCHAMPCHVIPCSSFIYLERGWTLALACAPLDAAVVGTGVGRAFLRKADAVLPCASLRCHAMPCRTIPYHTVPYRTIPYHTVPYRTMPAGSYAPERVKVGGQPVPVPRHARRG